MIQNRDFTSQGCSLSALYCFASSPLRPGGERRGHAKWVRLFSFPRCETPLCLSLKPISLVQPAVIYARNSPRTSLLTHVKKQGALTKAPATRALKRHFHRYVLPFAWMPTSQSLHLGRASLWRRNPTTLPLGAEKVVSRLRVYALPPGDTKTSRLPLLH